MNIETAANTVDARRCSRLAASRRCSPTQATAAQRHDYNGSVKILLSVKTKIVCYLLALIVITSTPAQAQNVPADEMNRRNIERRAVEAVIWGMPAVNYDLMLQEMLTKTAGKVRQVIYWGRPLDWHNQTLTPNPDALYFMVFFNTKDGPVVLELPAADGTDRSTPTS